MSSDASLFAFEYPASGRRALFYRDRKREEVVEFMRAFDGSAPNGSGSNPVVSGNGKSIVFESSASNLLQRPDTNGLPDVFAYDVVSGRTTLVSTARGDGRANGASRRSSVSANGRYVAFESDASNLVPGDENGTTDVFVRDLVDGTTALVSVSVNGGSAAGTSHLGGQFRNGASLDDEGTAIAFVSEASDVVAGDVDADGDAFIHDLRAGNTTRVPLETVEEKSHPVENVTISPDGRLVAISGCRHSEDQYGCQTYVFDRETGALTAEEENTEIDATPFLALSRGGRFLVRTNVRAPGDGFSAVKDRSTGTDTSVTIGTISGISADAKYIALEQELSTGGIPGSLIYDRIRKSFTPALDW